MNKILISLAFVFLALISLGFVSAQTTAQSPTVCCEKTISGLFCQDVPQEQCNPDVRKVPTSCEATSYCKPGTCFNAKEGTCLDNTPQNTCNLNGGIWTDKPAPQCELACCILGDQAAFVTLTRCKKLSSDLGLETNYKKDIKDEVGCISSVLGQEKGACVFESEFQKTCRITTRAGCAGGVSGTQTKGTFFTGKLCSAEELGTNCAPSTKTACVPGKEEVYAIDTCSNVANIYDSSNQNWEDILDKSEIKCNWATGSNCGNCNYLEGSVCRTDTKGNAKCTDLNCKKTSNGNDYKHGESWCVYDDLGDVEDNNAVGSRFYKHICINGEEVLEQCDDFRRQICISDSINYTGKTSGTFSQAACRVNRWQDCVMQTTLNDCENTDKRDCTWLPEITGEISVKNSLGRAESKTKTIDVGRCVPKVSPGLNFWEGEEAAAICGQASVTFEAKSEKALLGGDKTWLDPRVDNNGNPTATWLARVGTTCHALGDCVGTVSSGTIATQKINWFGAKSRNGA